MDEKDEASRRPPAALRLLWPHLRLTFAALTAAVVFLLLPPAMGDDVRFLASFDVAAVLWLALALHQVVTSDATVVRRHAKAADEGAWAAFLIGLLASGAGVVAVVLEAHASGEGASHRLGHIPLVVGTLVLAWLFFHTVFAFHYAREFYRPEVADAHPMLKFPGAGEPDYWDFLYFAFNIGTASQTADVSITSPRLRRLVLGHQIASYLFNATIIALGVNVAAALV
ncbi:DUF1345 domain-containing protein [Xanthobacter sediminis]